MDENYDFEKKSGRKKRIITAVISVLLVVALALVAASLVKQFIITTYIVDGISMYPTLDGGSGAVSDSRDDNGETLYLNKLADIKRGDIVVFKNPGWQGIASALVKRVIALGGDRLCIEGDAVYVNGQLLDESGYAVYSDNVTVIGPGSQRDADGTICYTVPDGYVFCMGDNRDNSTDCRVFGPFSQEYVVGSCFAIKGLDGKFRFL